MWTVADTHTGMAGNGMVWYGMAWGCGLRPPPRLRRGHHRAGGAEAGEAEAGAARAGAAAWSSEGSEAGAVVVGLGSPGDAGRERGSGATSGRQQQRGLVGRQSQGPSGSSGRASFTTHQHVQRKLKNVKGKNTSYTSHTHHPHARARPSSIFKFVLTPRTQNPP